MSFCELVNSFWIPGQARDDADTCHSALDAESIFKQAIHEAKQGLGFTHPNPSVGCVIVKNGQIIAQAHHHKAGEPHAEALALKQAGEVARGADLYVTLEPCNHFGRTPPCSQAIIQAGVKRVIYGVADPNPQVQGHGTQTLIQAGIVVEPISDAYLRALSEDLIRPFACSVQRERPFVVAKISTSLDGKIAFKSGKQTQLTGQEAQRFVHELREICDAVAVGANTVLVDNPQLTARFNDRVSTRQPARLVFDHHLRTDPKSRVYAADGALRCVVHASNAPKERLKLFEAAGIVCHSGGFADLWRTLGLTSVLLEGGGVLLSSFLKSGWVDELAWLTAPKILGNQGVASVAELDQAIDLSRICEQTRLGSDFLTIASCQKLNFLPKDPNGKPH